MRFYLAKTLDNMKKYGPTIDLTMETADRVEEHVLEFDENEWIVDNMVDRINAACDTSLDDGDYDFFDTSQCEKLLVLFDEIDWDSIPEKYQKILKVLQDYSKRAVVYKTGIAIDL